MVFFNQPTVITPVAAPISQPVQQVESVAAQAKLNNQASDTTTQQRPIVITFTRRNDRVVNEVIDENAEQAVRDLWSPILIDRRKPHQFITELCAF